MDRGESNTSRRSLYPRQCRFLVASGSSSSSRNGEEWTGFSAAHLPPHSPGHHQTHRGGIPAFKATRAARCCTAKHCVSLRRQQRMPQHSHFLHNQRFQIAFQNGFGSFQQRLSMKQNGLPQSTLRIIKVFFSYTSYCTLYKLYSLSQSPKELKRDNKNILDEPPIMLTGSGWLIGKKVKI